MWSTNSNLKLNRTNIILLGYTIYNFAHLNLKRPFLLLFQFKMQVYFKNMYQELKYIFIKLMYVWLQMSFANPIIAYITIPIKLSHIKLQKLIISRIKIIIKKDLNWTSCKEEISQIK